VKSIPHKFVPAQAAQPAAMEHWHEGLRRKLSTVRRILRSPAMIVGEIATIALAGAVGATLPQANTASVESLSSLYESGSLLAALTSFLSLDHVFHSPWFLTLTLVTATSLWIVVAEQVRRLRAAWAQRPTLAHFQSAPFRIEFERPARLRVEEPHLKIWTEKRIGLTGSVMLHLGLLLVIIAGALRALFGSEALVDLVEGETLPPITTGWGAQFPGLLGKPFRLEDPVVLTNVKVRHYADGDLRDLRVELAVQRKHGVELAELAVNHDLKAGGGRVFLGADFGPAALLEWQSPNAESRREAILLTDQGKRGYEATSSGPNGLRAHLRTHIQTNGDHPKRMEIRVMKAGALLFTGENWVGQAMVLPGGEQLVLHGLPFWARLRGSHDSALWLAYAGFALVLAGSVIIFTLVKVDGCVAVTPVGEKEKVFLALKPHRFAPLFTERFQQLVRQQNGSPISGESHPVEAMPMGIANFRPASMNPEPACPLATPPPCAAKLRGASICGWLLVSLLLSAGCHRSAPDQARELVERYNQVVAEAYRRGDPKLINSVVGPKEGRKITGLIGVRLDLGLTLDSQLISLEVTGAKMVKDEMHVQTRECWHYRDRKIGTGAQVGEDSLDVYGMLYVFKKTEGAWLVEEIRFTSEPQISRKRTTWIAERVAPDDVASPTKAPEIQKP